MLIRVLLFLLVVIPWTYSLQAAWWENIKSSFVKEEPPKPPKIKVLVAHDLEGTVIEVKGRYSLFDPRTDEHVAFGMTGKRKFMQALSDGLKWDEEFPGIHQLKIVPESGATIVVHGVEYAGAIYVYDIGGTISIVNEVDIESYLKSLLSADFRVPLPDEALAAVAIAARTSAYKQTEKPKSVYWAVDGRKLGYEGNVAVTGTSPIERAIDTTRFMVMSTPESYDGDVIPFLAEWGSSTGGKKMGESSKFAHITLFEASNMAAKGENAAQILNKAFPGSKIVLMQYQVANN